MLKVIRTADIAHEDETFERPHIRAGCYHIDRNGNAEVRTVAELREDALRILVRRVCHLLAKVIPRVEDLADDIHNVIGM